DRVQHNTAASWETRGKRSGRGWNRHLEVLKLLPIGTIQSRRTASRKISTKQSDAVGTTALQNRRHRPIPMRSSCNAKPIEIILGSTKNLVVNEKKIVTLCGGDEVQPGALCAPKFASVGILD